MTKKRDKRRIAQESAAREIAAGAPSVGSVPGPDAICQRECVVFSFKHAALRNSKFSLQNENKKYLLALIERLKGIGQMPLEDFVNTPGNDDALSSHLLRFEDTSESQGFPLPREQWEERPWQFHVTRTTHGRIHGFLIGNIFYVVWFDPGHKLFPRK